MEASQIEAVVSTGAARSPAAAWEGARIKASWWTSPAFRYLLNQRLFARWAFIHINKCGGTSVERLLGIPKIHDTASQRIAIVGERRWAQMYTFSMVRNPLTRLPSLYRYRVKTNQTGLGDHPISFEDWIRAAVRDKDPAYYDKPLMFAPASSWICNGDGKLLVNRVLRLETAQAEWPEVAQMIGAPAALPHENQTHRDYEKLDAETHRTILDVYRKDFALFGYES